MPEKQVKPVAIRLGEELSTRLQDTIDKSGLVYNKQEFTMYAIKRTFDYIFYEFGISKESDEIDYDSVANVLTMMDLCKKEFDRAKGDQCQFIIRMPMELYRRVEHMSKLLDLSIQDFIKGSIIFEMRTIENFNSDYSKWKEVVDSLDIDSFCNKLYVIQQSQTIPKR